MMPTVGPDVFKLDLLWASGNPWPVEIYLGSCIIRLTPILPKCGICRVSIYIGIVMMVLGHAHCFPTCTLRLLVVPWSWIQRLPASSAVSFTSLTSRPDPMDDDQK